MIEPAAHAGARPKQEPVDVPEHAPVLPRRRPLVAPSFPRSGRLLTRAQKWFRTGRKCCISRVTRVDPGVRDRREPPVADPRNPSGSP